MANVLYGTSNFSTTLNVGGGINNSQTTGLILTSVSGLNTNGGMLGIDWATTIDTSVYEVIEYGGITGNELTGVIRGQAGTSAKAHNNGATIVAVVSAVHNNRVADKLRSVDTTLAQDTNNNAIIKTAFVASAVNQVTMTNAATLNAPSVSATGTDTNVDLNLITKGSGVVKFNGVAAPTSTVSTDGWTTSSDTWVYASASTFTIAGVDRTAIYTKGTRLKFTNSTLKYAVVTSSSFSTNTTVTIAINNDYVLTNTTISSPFYSYEVNPQGYPGWFAYTSTFTGFSVNPTGIVTRFCVNGRVCVVTGSDTGNGTSNTTAKTWTVPIASGTAGATASLSWVTDNNVQTHGAHSIGANSASIAAYVGPGAGTNWTASGNCRLFTVGVTIVYEI